MAAKMNSSVLDIKIKVVEDLEAQFHKKLTVFASDVKTKMQTSSQELANQVFELTLLFLSQVFPNIDNMESAGMESSEDKMKTAEKLKEIQAKLNDHEEKFEEYESNYNEFKDRMRKLESQVEKKQEKIEGNVKDVEKKLKRIEGNVKDVEKKQTRIEGNVKDVEKKQEKLDEEIKDVQEESKKNNEELKESTQCNKNTIAGLRKLQILFKSKLQESKTTTSPQHMPTTTTSASSPQVSTTTTSTSASTVQSFRASAATATLSGAPLSLSQTSNFTLRWPYNEHLDISDVKLLTSTLLLVAHYANACIILFDTKGQQLSTSKLQSPPLSLTILNQKSPSCWSVAVALTHSNFIGLVEIKNQTLSMKSVINTQRRYTRIAAMNSTTLAAGCGIFYGGGCEVHLIDLSGKVLRSICSGVTPWSMVTTEDNCLIVLDGSKTFYRFNLQQGTQDIKRDISQIGSLGGIACLQSDLFIVADSDKQVLHLVGDDGRVKRILWNCPRVDRGDYLDFVSVMKDVCVCCTRLGSVFVFNVQGI